MRVKSLATVSVYTVDPIVSSTSITWSSPAMLANDDSALVSTLRVVSPHTVNQSTVAAKTIYA